MPYSDNFGAAQPFHGKLRQSPVIMQKKTILFSIIFMFLSALSFAQVLPMRSPEVPEIRLPSDKGDTISLSSLRGKVVLLDFWASWCGPCRLKNRNVFSEVYEKFKGPAFEMLAVSVDTDKRAWQRAIKRDRADWLQVIDPGNFDSPTARQWQIIYLPSTFLIDKNGQIVAVDPSQEELEKLIPVLQMESYQPIKGKEILQIEM